MRWLVAMDLRPDGRGALELVGWLVGHHAGIGRADVSALLVVPDTTYLTARRGPLHDVAAVGPRGAMLKAIDGTSARGRIGEVGVVTRGPVDEVLTAEAEARQAVLVLGRRAEREDDAPVRLGRVGRRVLRHLPGPVVVVPPDLDARGVGKGPVLVAVDEAHGGGALRFARWLGAAIGREVEPLPITEVQGSVVDAAVSEARRSKACMIVCDARRHTAPQLAGWAECAVAIVAPEWTSAESAED